MMMIEIIMRGLVPRGVYLCGKATVGMRALSGVGWMVGSMSLRVCCCGGRGGRAAVRKAS